MTRIKLFLMRHSKSCSNHVRASAPGGPESESDPTVIVSKEIRDPGLSVLGSSVARTYGPTLRRSLSKEGFGLDGAFIGASSLRRAQDTARLIFGRSPVALPHFTENGQIPENTPAGSPYAAPNWSHFVAHLSTLVRDGDSVAVVGHGSFLLSLWPTLTGKARGKRLNNLDGILLDADIDAHGLRVLGFKEIRAPVFDVGADKCDVEDTRKIKGASRSMTRQRGGNGSAGMPLGFFNDGAQMRGTMGEQTGVGLAGSSGSWVRAPLNQTGGRRRATRRKQQGGFSPSVMGAFASNGMQLLPMAGYMGYKMYSNQPKATRKTKRRTRGSRRR
jgi:broad specificity phosphatase PhoE